MWREQDEPGEQTRRFEPGEAEENTQRLAAEPDEFDYNRPRTCPDCSSEMQWAGTGPHLYLIHDEDKDNLLIQRTSPVAALVCSHCGFTKLYAKRRDKLI